MNDFDDIVKNAEKPPVPAQVVRPKHSDFINPSKGHYDFGSLDYREMCATLASMLGVQYEGRPKDEVFRDLYWRVRALNDESRKRSYYDSWRDGTYQNGL